MRVELMGSRERWKPPLPSNHPTHRSKQLNTVRRYT
jgi:hypothetical protein